MMKFASILLFISVTAFSNTEITGFAKLNAQNISRENTDDYDEFVQWNRVTLNSQFAKNFSFETSYEINQIYSTINIPYYDQARPYRVDDLNSVMTTNDPYYFLTQNLDRFMLTYEREKYSVTFGRQQIAFGSARATNPTDVFTPFGFLVIDTEVRPGVDGVRFRHQVGEMGQLDIGVILGEDSKEENSAVYGALRLVYGDYEIQPIFSNFKKAQMIGLDLTTTIGGASVWWESAFVTPSDEERYYRSTIGWNDQVESDTTLFFEYHYNGAGQADVDEYQGNLNSFAYQSGGVFLYGKNYLDLGVSYLLGPLSSLSYGIKNNLSDRSTLWSLVWEWNAYTDFYFNLGGFIGTGATSNSILNAKSEFGNFKRMLFTRLRYYF